MLVNNDSLGTLRRSASLGLGLSWMALALTLAGGALALIGSFDTNVGHASVIVRYGDPHLPEYAIRSGAVSYLVFAVALWQLILFLRLTRDGRVFVAEATSHLRSFGRWLLVAAAAATLTPLCAVALHRLILGPEAGRISPIRVPLTTGLFVLAIATLVMMICRIIDEGRRIRDELDGIV